MKYYKKTRSVVKIVLKDSVICRLLKQYKNGFSHITEGLDYGRIEVTFLRRGGLL